MADSKNKYEIVIKIEEGAGEGNTPFPSGQNGTSNAGRKQTTDYSSKLANLVAAKTIEAGLKRVTNFVTSNVQLVTGSTELQEKVNAVMKLANYGSQMLTNVTMASTVATKAGLSSGAGVALGVGLTVVGIAMDYAEKKAQLRINQTLENQRLEQIRSRAGYAFNRSRTGAN